MDKQAWKTEFRRQYERHEQELRQLFFALYPDAQTMVPLKQSCTGLGLRVHPPCAGLTGSGRRIPHGTKATICWACVSM